jgi:hypothetical protein
VIVCVATLSVLVENVVEPFESPTVPSVVDPSLNVTLPPGVPVTASFVEDTVAVNVTLAENVDGLSDEESETVTPSWFTTCERGDDVLPEKFVLPPYTAVIMCGPIPSALVVYVAVVPLMVPVPRAVAPSLKVTVPLGVPAPGVVTERVAVNVTDASMIDGLLVDIRAVAVEA